jgi:hypothetical protein
MTVGKVAGLGKIYFCSSVDKANGVSEESWSGPLLARSAGGLRAGKTPNYRAGRGENITIEGLNVQKIFCFKTFSPISHEI